MSHTPGPWVIDEFYTQGGFYKIRAADSALCHVHSFTEDGGLPTEEESANARLIAAAPELLEACKGVYDEHEHDHDRTTCWVCTKLRAAIAKAEPKKEGK